MGLLGADNAGRPRRALAKRSDRAAYTPGARAEMDSQSRRARERRRRIPTLLARLRDLAFRAASRKKRVNRGRLFLGRKAESNRHHRWVDSLTIRSEIAEPGILKRRRSLVSLASLADLPKAPSPRYPDPFRIAEGRARDKSVRIEFFFFFSFHILSLPGFASEPTERRGATKRE